MRKGIIGALSTFSCVLGLATAAPAPAQEKVGVVTTAIGPVSVARASLPPEPLKFKDDVFVHDRVTTGEDAITRILLGGKVIVTARERSTLTITEVPGLSTINLTSKAMTSAAAVVPADAPKQGAEIAKVDSAAPASSNSPSASSGAARSTGAGTSTGGGASPATASAAATVSSGAATPTTAATAPASLAPASTLAASTTAPTPTAVAATATTTAAPAPVKAKVSHDGLLRASSPTKGKGGSN
jgi:hypothetical protein